MGWLPDELRSDNYFKKADELAPHIKVYADACLTERGYDVSRLIGAVYSNHGADFHSRWHVSYYFNPPDRDGYPAGIKEDVQVNINDKGECLIFKPKEAEKEAECFKPMAEFVAKEQLKRLGVDVTKLQFHSRLYSIDLEKTWWMVKAWFPPAPDDPWLRGDYEIIVDATGTVVNAERLTNHQRDYHKGRPEMETLYRPGLPAAEEASRRFPLYQIPSEELTKLTAKEPQGSTAATSLQPPNSPTHPSKYKIAADGLLRESGYDPDQFRSMIWFWGEWRVSYWPTLAPVWRRGLPYIPPDLIVHFGFDDKNMSLEVADKKQGSR